MRADQIELLIELVREEHNANQSSVLYMEYLMQTPEQFRIEPIPDEEAFRVNLHSLKKRAIILNETLNELYEQSGICPNPPTQVTL